MNAQDIVGAVSANLGLDPPSAEKAVGTILSVLQHEAGPENMAAIYAKLPGSDVLAQRYDVMAAAGTSGGLLGSLSSALGGALGEKAGALVNGVSQLEGLGLSVAQIREVGMTLIAKAKAAAGPQAVAGLFEAAPALKGHFG